MDKGEGDMHMKHSNGFLAVLILAVLAVGTVAFVQRQDHGEAA